MLPRSSGLSSWSMVLSTTTCSSAQEPASRFSTSDLTAPSCATTSFWVPSISLSSEYYRPLTPKTKWFIAPKVAFNSNTFNVYQDQKLLAQYRQRVLGGGIDGGYAISAAQQIRFGYSTAYERYSSQIGEVPDYPMSLDEPETRM